MKRFALFSAAVLGLSLLVAACTTSRGGYETAAYTVVKSEGSFEVRDYPELKVVATAMDPAVPDRDDRFMRLFRYIDGNNAASQKVSMTTPVFMTGGTKTAGAQGATAAPEKMNFVVPAAVAAAGAPAPTAGNVTLESLPARRVAVVRFAGRSSPAVEQTKLAEVRAWIERQGLTTAGEPFLAYYNPPWTPGPLRRNEVLVPLKK
jgi:DNA gyrase inhibitor GyrI